MKANESYTYSETDDASVKFTFNLEEIKQVIDEHNEHFETSYKTIKEFNDGEEYRTIKKQQS